MLILQAAKMFVFSGIMITLAGAAIGTGMLFASYNLSVAKNPEEAENLFNTTLMAFALVETFVFLSFLIAAVIYLLV